MKKINIVGAGVSGLIAAKILEEHFAKLKKKDDKKKSKKWKFW